MSEEPVPAGKQKSLRILQVATSGTVGTLDMGPVSTNICALVNGLQKLGHELTLTDAPADLPRVRLEPGIRVLTVRPSTRRRQFLMSAPKMFSRIYIWLCAVFYVWSLCRQVNFDEFDVVHVHLEHIAFLLAATTGAKYVYTAHTPLWALELDQGIKFGVGRRAEAWIERFALRKAQMGISLGEFLIRAVPRATITKIPNGTDLQRWQRLDRHSARAATKLPDEDFVVLFIGRLHPQKGVDVLIEAVRRLAPERPRLSLVIIGPPGGNFEQRGRASPYVERLMESAKDLPVRFTGFISNESREFLAYLSATDLAVFPSRLEPQGNVVMEALAMSVPVIAARTGGMADIVTDDVGLLVPPDDPDALTTAISALYDHPEVLDSMRPNCRRRIEDHYSWEQIVKKHAELFEAMATAAADSERVAHG